MKIRYALVGCGRISKNHLDGIEKSDISELVAVCDVVEEKAKKLR